MMHGPAHMAGLGELHSFLERGFDAFRMACSDDADEFLATIISRERENAFSRRVVHRRRACRARLAALRQARRQPPGVSLSIAASICSWQASSSALARRTSSGLRSTAPGFHCSSARVRVRRIGFDHQGVLAACHRQEDFGKQFGVEQGAVQCPLRVVDGVALA